MANQKLKDLLSFSLNIGDTCYLRLDPTFRIEIISNFEVRVLPHPALEDEPTDVGSANWALRLGRNHYFKGINGIGDPNDNSQVFYNGFIVEKDAVKRTIRKWAISQSPEGLAAAQEKKTTTILGVDKLRQQQEETLKKAASKMATISDGIIEAERAKEARIAKVIASEDRKINALKAQAVHAQKVIDEATNNLAKLDALIEKQAAEAEASKQEVEKQEPAKSEAPKQEAPKSKTPRAKVPNSKNPASKTKARRRISRPKTA